jgi:hypothetical protein
MNFKNSPLKKAISASTSTLCITRQSYSSGCNSSKLKNIAHILPPRLPSEGEDSARACECGAPRTDAVGGGALVSLLKVVRRATAKGF